jgi:hypothetical protein
VPRGGWLPLVEKLASWLVRTILRYPCQMRFFKIYDVLPNQ